MENYVSFNVKERFPVGNKGVALLQYPTEPPHFEICLYSRGFQFVKKITGDNASVILVLYLSFQMPLSA